MGGSGVRLLTRRRQQPVDHEAITRAWQERLAASEAEYQREKALRERPWRAYKPDITPAEDYGDGYTVGSKAQLSDDLPHPGNRRHPENYYNGMRAALRGRGLDVSMFLRVIEKDPR